MVDHEWGHMAEDEYDDWTSGVQRSLARLQREHVPALEYVLLDGLATWLFSDSNPGAEYDQDTAAQVISVLFSALDAAREVVPQQGPPDEAAIGASRDALVAGAHQLSEGRGVTIIITRAMPAMLGELESHAGDPGKQLHSAYFYLLLAIATGAEEFGDPEVAEGLFASFAAWDGLFASGAVSRLGWS